MKRLVVYLMAVMGTSLYAQNKNISGKVFEDVNKNGQYDKGEPLLKDVLISNGQDLVKTNQKGEYKINTMADMQVFIVKPTGYQSSLSKENKVNFYLPYADLGKVNTHDFALYKQDESKPLNAVLLADLQSDVLDDIHHVEKLVISE
ncbi:MAG: metallophosphoesterase N-terminal domain-containing protein [Flavobacterium sp.]